MKNWGRRRISFCRLLFALVISNNITIVITVCNIFHLISFSNLNNQFNFAWPSKNLKNLRMRLFIFAQFIYFILWTLFKERVTQDISLICYSQCAINTDSHKNSQGTQSLPHIAKFCRNPLITSRMKRSFPVELNRAFPFLRIFHLISSTVYCA